MTDTNAQRLLYSDPDRCIEFERVPLQFKGDICTNVFALKNNKTLAQTLEHPRYAGLAKLALTKHLADMEMPLGCFLLELKDKGDAVYRRFLNY